MTNNNCFAHFGLGECTDEMLSVYAAINDRYWELLEKGGITRQELFTARFRDFFEKEGIAFDKLEEFNKEYQTVCVYRKCCYTQRLPWQRIRDTMLELRKRNSD